ncbi:MAG: type I phosphomannose isomerase catalytic subunit [Kiritimatiellia bacterium]
MKLESNLHTLVWGTESWEVSAHVSSPSIIADGPDKGKALSEVKPGFPLLIKVIDAKRRLSVQVHPNNANAALTGGEPKTEMWVLLEDGVIYAGLKPGVGPRDIEEAVKTGAFEDLMVRHDAKKGEAYFIPGGLVHAIAENTKIYEVQQSSNTTYRLYDWGRVGADGKPRQLHIAESLKSIDFTLPVPQPCTNISCPYFDFRQEYFSSPAAVSAPANSFLVVYEVDSAQSTLLNPGEKMIVSGRAFLTKLP